MRKILSALLFLGISLSSFAQPSTEELHKMFLAYLEKGNVDSIYNHYGKVGKDDPAYEEALEYRNQYGWAMNKVEELKKDIPAILSLDKYAGEMVYGRIARPQEFPPSEWGRFITMATELLQYFEKDSAVYRELIGLKTQLEYVSGNDEALLRDLPKLLSLLDPKGDAYPVLLWQQANLFLRNDQLPQAIELLKKGLELKNKSDHLHSLVELYSSHKEFDKVLELEKNIVADPSGILLFNLAEAQWKAKKEKEAKKNFDLFVSKLTFNEKNNFVELRSNTIVYSIYPEKLSVLGDFYFASNKEEACKYYSFAKEILSEPKEDAFSNRRLEMTKDEAKKQKMIAKKEKKQKEDAQLLAELESKLKKCRD